MCILDEAHLLAAARYELIETGLDFLPSDFGALCAFICGSETGYITGQNFLIDGGAYPGTYRPASRAAGRVGSTARRSRPFPDRSTRFDVGRSRVRQSGGSSGS